MPAIQSSVGLVSGLPITDIVDQLMSIAQKPRDRLEERMAAVQKQQVAISELTALTISMQLASNRLANESVYQQRTATSSDSGLLAASVTGNPTPGTYQFTPVRTAQNHQLVSQGFASLDDPIGESALSFGGGGFVDRGLNLELLNEGAGVERGKIRITDRSGASEVIDLRFVQTIDDVLAQINGNENIDVLAVADGDAIRLVDQTGLSLSNLSVAEVGGGNTAADLGLANINVAASEATGSGLVGLYDSLRVSQLNDGSGLSIRNELTDLVVAFRDGSTALEIDLDRDAIQTVGELVDALNAADPARLQAAIGSNGNLVLNDLTTDSGGTFSISSGVGGSLAEDLGLTRAGAGDVVTGRRIVGGLQGPLLTSLGGGYGLGQLGQISLTDRSGASATVDLAAAVTLNDVIDLLNNTGIRIRADINDSRSGIVLQDTTGAAGNLVVANGSDGTNTADVLGLTINAAQKSVDSGSLHLQTLHEDTRLESLNNGNGVHLGSLLITDTLGNSSGINLRTSGAETIGDVVDLVNGMGLAVEARVNDRGDGIVLIDTAGGAGTLEVTESGSGTTAADLKLLGTATEVDIGGTPTQVIDGSMSSQLDISDSDTLQDLVDKINALELGVSASILQTGSGATPYHIVLTSESSGSAGEIMLDASQFGVDFWELTPAQDAVLQIGSADLPGAGILATSSTNQFTDVVDGLKLTVGGVSHSPVTINVEASDQSLVSNAKLLVDQYNKLREKIDELTFFDAETETTGVLMGSHETLQIESRLNFVLTGRFFGSDSIQSLQQIGISFNDDGTLELDEFKLQDRFAEDPEGVRQFFTDEEFGFVTKLNDAIDAIAGEGDSLLLGRTEVLQRRVDSYVDRLEFYNERLENERERLLKYYYNLELAIAKIQSSQTALAALQPLPPQTSAASSSVLG